LARQGLGYKDMRAVNPRLIYCSVTGYGQTGPKRNDAGIDGALQAASGMMSITGTTQSGPTKSGFAIIDYSTGYAAALAVAGALYKRERTGNGQHIDVAMMEVALAMMSSHVTEALTRGRPPVLNGNRTGRSYVNTALRCKEGVLLIAASQDTMRERLYEAIGRSDIPRDPRFSTQAACRENLELLEAEVEKTLMTKTAQEWEEILAKAGVAAMKVRSIAEAAAHPQVQERGFFHTFNTAEDLGLNITVPLSPYRFSDYPAHATLQPPRHGEHTQEILAGLGFAEAEIAQLRQEGVV
jgi:crotonobetainyl-CoA:carnitine CoA-transferase CaiB-like acyl-CoA transferase